MKWDAGTIYDVLHDLSQRCFFLLYHHHHHQQQQQYHHCHCFFYMIVVLLVVIFWNILLLLQYYCYYYCYPIFFVINQYGLTWGDMFLFCFLLLFLLNPWFFIFQTSGTPNYLGECIVGCWHLMTWSLCIARLQSPSDKLIEPLKPDLPKRTWFLRRFESLGLRVYKNRSLCFFCFCWFVSRSTSTLRGAWHIHVLHARTQQYDCCLLEYTCITGHDGLLLWN